MSFNVSGHNIFDIYVGNSKLDKIFVGEDLVYSSGPNYMPLCFEIASASVSTAQISFQRDETMGAVVETCKKYDLSSMVSLYPSYTDPSWLYSFDGNTWVQYEVGTNIVLGGSNSRKVYLKSAVDYTASETAPWNQVRVDTSSKFSTTYYSFLRFCSDAALNVSGVCNSILSDHNKKWNIDLRRCFLGLFAYAPIISAPELPALSLHDYSYGSMFFNCTSLTTPPILPALDLGSYCYSGMFSNCSALNYAPELPALNLASYCYRGMFEDAKVLVPPYLPATELAEHCYDSMFRKTLTSNPGKLTTVPKLLATDNLPAGAYYAMFESNVTSSETSTSTCPYAYRIPYTGTGTADPSAAMEPTSLMFGDSYRTPALNQTFYISVPVQQ
jgi:hypothetical protein